MANLDLHAALLIGASLLSECAMEGFNKSTCIPIAQCDRRFLGRAEIELKQLPPQSAIEEMLSDYTTLREQNTKC